MGISAIGDRTRILEEIEKGPPSVDKATAPTEKARYNIVDHFLKPF